jgi:hypothetical protein
VWGVWGVWGDVSLGIDAIRTTISE